MCFVLWQRRSRTNTHIRKTRDGGFLLIAKAARDAEKRGSQKSLGYSTFGGKLVKNVTKFM